MKKFVLTAFTIFAAFAGANAQSFTLSGDTVRGVASDNGAHVGNVITNTTSSPITITWRVISHDIPAAPSKWNTSFGICDNSQCYGPEIITLSGGSYPTKTSLNIPAAGNMDVYIGLGDLSGVTTYGPYTVRIEFKNGSTTDTTTYIVNKWATSVSNNVKSNDNIAVYPNPAHSEVNVVFNSMPEVKSIAIYNLIGKMVSVYKVSGTSAQLDVSNTPTGIYIIRLMDAQGHMVATRKFTHQ